jgi:hypothetical protein
MKLSGITYSSEHAQEEFDVIEQEKTPKQRNDAQRWRSIFNKSLELTSHRELGNVQ